MNVVIYARYSDSKQREESIEAQLKICHEYAQQMGYTVIREYVDRALSGRSDDRPQFQLMLKHSERGQFSKVLIYRFDRFSRGKYTPFVHLAALEERGVDVESVKELVPEGPLRDLVLPMIIGSNSSYSRELGEKVKRNLDLNADKCLSNGGTTPLGYKLEKVNPKSEKSKKKYIIDEMYAPIVKEIFQKYARGWSMKKICDDLNARQLKTAQGVAFNKNSLHTLLKNRKYLGIYIYNGREIPGGMPQIIDQELFDKVQDVMKTNKKAPARSRARAEYILSGKLFCGYCRNGMVGVSANKKINGESQIYNYYRCKTSLHQKTCKKKTVRKEYIEDIVISECKRLLTAPNIKRIAKEVVKIAQSMEDNSEIKRLEKSVKELENSKENQMVNLRACKDDAVRNMLLEDLSKLAADIKAATEQLEREKARHYLVTEDQVIEYLTQLAQGDISNLTYRKALIRLFVNKIFLYDDKLIITFTTGDEDVAIEDKLLDRIESDLSDEKFCISNVVGHQETEQALACSVFLCFLGSHLFFSSALSFHQLEGAPTPFPQKTLSL